jgi:hypothetical protein
MHRLKEGGPIYSIEVGRLTVSKSDALWERYWYSFPASEIKESNMPRFIGKAPFDPNLSPPQKLPESTPREMLRQDSGNI